jgi:hypothetical protein
MLGNDITLNDGTILNVKVSFGTMYFLNKQDSYKKIQEKLKENPNSDLSDNENLEMAACFIYAILRSNGRTLSFDDCISLVPLDTSKIEQLFNEFKEQIDKYKKKEVSNQIRPV